MNLHTDIMNRSGMGWDHNEMGRTYLEMGDIAHARECFVQARVTADQLDDSALKAAVDKSMAELYLEEGLIQKVAEDLYRAEALAHKTEARELLSEMLLLWSRLWLVMGDVKRARETINSATALIDVFDFRRLRASLGVLQGEILAVEGKREEAAVVFQDTAILAKKYSQRRQRAEALLGLVQTHRKDKRSAQLGLTFFHVEKDLRIVASRKLKLKFLAIKGVLAGENKGTFDNRYFNQSLAGVTSIGLRVLEKQLLELAIGLVDANQFGQELNSYRRDLEQLLEKGPVDLHLARPRTEWFSALPVSVGV